MEEVEGESGQAELDIRCRQKKQQAGQQPHQSAWAAESVSRGGRNRRCSTMWSHRFSNFKTLMSSAPPGRPGGFNSVTLFLPAGAAMHHNPHISGPAKD